MAEVAISNVIWQRATDLAWTLDRKGKILPVSDLIIACCALHVGARVVSVDPHFREIPGLKVCQELPDLAFGDGGSPAPIPPHAPERG